MPETEPIIVLADEANRSVLGVRAAAAEPGNMAVWVEVAGMTAGKVSYSLYSDAVQHAREGDAVHRENDITVVVPSHSIGRLHRSIVDVGRADPMLVVRSSNHDISPRLEPPDWDPLARRAIRRSRSQNRSSPWGASKPEHRGPRRPRRTRFRRGRPGICAHGRLVRRLCIGSGDPGRRHSSGHSSGASRGRIGHRCDKPCQRHEPLLRGPNAVMPWASVVLSQLCGHGVSEPDIRTSCPHCGQMQRLDQALRLDADWFEVVYRCASCTDPILVVSTAGALPWEGRGLEVGLWMIRNPTELFVRVHSFTDERWIPAAPSALE